MIAQGSAELNIIVGVENKDFNRAVAALYETFAAEAKEVRAQQAQNA
jgi:aspartate kinase